MLPVLPVSNVANDQLVLDIGTGNISTLATFSHFHIGNIIKSVLCFLMFALFAHAEPAYTNHAGNVALGVVIALDARTATISNAAETVKLPLSIFPESEQRRIAADFVLRHQPSRGYGTIKGGGYVDQLRVPVAVKRAVAGAEKAMARSRKRAEKGLCTKEESDAFCEKSAAALKSYLDKQVKEGVITPAERKALGR
jgi:hypothetical protein